jgi:predicted aconitase
VLHLEADDQAILDGDAGPAPAMAMRILRDMAGILGAERLLSIASAHIDGCLYHGDSGVEFAERLRDLGARVVVRTTLNVGGLDLLHPRRVREDGHRNMARRQMAAYVEMGCTPTWTCAPYQAGHRPGVGEHVAWGESNAVAFANSVLGARTNRYGDFLDICCALVGRAPDVGLHRDENRYATVVVDVSDLSPVLRSTDALYPVLGSWLGRECGDDVVVIQGLEGCTTEDRLKALGASAASTGAVGLFHVAGVTPEAPDVSTALGRRSAERLYRVTPAVMRKERDRLSSTGGERVDAVALGSPHFSSDEFGALERRLEGRSASVPTFVCTGRSVLESLGEDRRERLTRANIRLVADTCVVVAPILPPDGGVLMTNSGKFAHYTLPNTGYDVVFGSLDDCVESAVNGRVIRDESFWE